MSGEREQWEGLISGLLLLSCAALNFPPEIWGLQHDFALNAPVTADPGCPLHPILTPAASIPRECSPSHYWSHGWILK